MRAESYFHLSLNTTAAVAACESFNFLSGYKVEVAGDGVLERGCSYAEFKRGLEVLAVEEAADYAARKAVAAAYAVNDGSNSVFSGMIEFLGSAVVYASRPAVIRCGVAYTERAYGILEAEFCYHLLEYRLVAVKVELAGGYVGCFGLEAENEFCVFFVADARQRTS